MALINCPECNQSVSTEAKVCPHCGYPLDSYAKAQSTYPSPKNTDWLVKWRHKPSSTKFAAFIAFLISVVLLVISICLLVNDRDVVYYEYLNETVSYSKSIWVSTTYLSGCFALFMLLFFVLSLFYVKTIVKTIDGYNVAVYFGFWKNHLIIEDKECDSNFGSIFRHTFLSGELPNGRQVNVTLSFDSAAFKTE